MSFLVVVVVVVVVEVVVVVVVLVVKSICLREKSTCLLACSPAHFMLTKKFSA